jgi:radical SAM superfamily enzyme YgiQ (UPF0313 family)
MRYEGPIYRPPSEAGSLLIQATVGCPHNRCTFCMVYKNGPRFKIRSVAEIQQDMLEARRIYGDEIRTLFFPAGNTIAMKTKDLCDICVFARKTFSALERITVYGSSQYIHRKGPQDIKRLAQAGLSRIHVGLESGDDVVLRRIKKGTHRGEQVEAGQWVREAGIELSEYVILGIGGRDRSEAHALHTATALNAINPDFIRLRTFVPKINTPLLKEVQEGTFTMLGPHEVLRETELLVRHLEVSSCLTSDHYTNYLNVQGRLPEKQGEMLEQIRSALTRQEDSFRPFFVGTE